MTLRFYPQHLAGYAGWVYEIINNGRITKWGWSAGSRKDAEQDCAEAMRKGVGV